MLEDDPYGLVRFEGDAPPSLHALSEGRVAYSSSFSKTIAPGLRVGYFVLPQELERELEAAATGTYITPALLGQATVHEFLRRGRFEPNLERVRALLQARRDAMLAGLERHLPNAQWSRPEGGYFIWLTLGGPVESAEAGGVSFVRGPDFAGDANEVRLAYSFAAPDEITLGVERLAAALPVAV